MGQREGSTHPHTHPPASRVPAAHPHTDHRPSPEPGGWSTWPPAAKWAAGCGAGCAVFAVLNSLALWALVAFAFLQRPPAGMRARVEAPAAVAVGQTFPLTLTIRNEGKEAFTVTNVTVREATLRRFRIENPQPAPASGLPLPGVTAWSYNQTVAPGAKWSVRFEAAALEAGDLEGSIEIQAPLAPYEQRFRVEAAEKREEDGPHSAPR